MDFNNGLLNELLNIIYWLWETILFGTGYYQMISFLYFLLLVQQILNKYLLIE